MLIIGVSFARARKGSFVMRPSSRVFRWTLRRSEYPVPLRVRLMRRQWARGDARRDRGFTPPPTVRRYTNLSYGPNGAWNLLDVYTPKETARPLPVIVSVHGGGYFYGCKETYQYYCMDLARRGFGVVNFNYRLAPEYRFPAPLADLNAVLRWVCERGAEFGLDRNNLFLVGDSAGAQIASQYAAIWSDPSYARRFPFSVPDLRLAAVGLNCGMYDLRRRARERDQIIRDYLGPNPAVYGGKLDVLSHVGPNYPPAYFLSAPNDFLVGECIPTARLFASRGCETAYKIYGERADPMAGHVFHVNPALAIAKEANDDETAFFRRFLR